MRLVQSRLLIMAVFRTFGSSCSLVTLASRHQAFNIGRVLSGDQFGLGAQVLEACPAFGIGCVALFTEHFATLIETDFVNRLIRVTVVLRIVISVKLFVHLLHVFFNLVALLSKHFKAILSRVVLI